MFFVGEMGELLDQLDLLGIVGMMAGAVEIVEPFREVHVVKLARIVGLPSAFPRLVGLIFSCDEAPVVAADLFHIEEREKAKNVVVKNASEPFGVDDRSALLLQALDDTHVCIVITVEMIRDQIRIFKDDLFDLLVRIVIAGIQDPVAHPNSAG